MRSLKGALEENYGERLRIVTRPQQSPIVSLVESVDDMVRSFYDASIHDESSNDSFLYNTQEEQDRILEAAGKILKNEVMSIACNTESYPSIDEMTKKENVRDILISISFNFTFVLL